MCLIAVGLKKDICSLNLDRAWSVNSDGAGLIIPKKSPIVIKGIMKLKTLKRTLNEIADDQMMALHLRAATHGAANEANTHPFKIGPISWLMHNGILSNLGKSGKDGFSDSAELASILANVRACDRKKILDLIPGRYAYIVGSDISLHGNFEKFQNVMCSNTYWAIESRIQFNTLGFSNTRSSATRDNPAWQYDPSERYYLNRDNWTEENEVKQPVKLPDISDLD